MGVEAHPLPSLPEVDRLWDQRPPYVFDAPAFCFSRVEENGKVIGHWVPYRFLYAQVVCPRLREVLGLVTLGVRGLAKREGSYLLGKRSQTVTQYPGLFEWAPGGVLSQLDYQTQLLEELDEETGMKGSSPIPFALVWNRPSSIVDICCHLEVVGEPQVSSEYTEYRWVPSPEGLPCVPTTRAILEAFNDYHLTS